MKNPIANNRSSAIIFGVAAFALTIIGVVLRIINLFSNFEIEAGYYYSSAPLVDVMHIFFAASVLVIGILSFITVKKMSLEAIDSEKDPTLKTVLCFLGIAALIYIVAKSYFDVYMAMNSSNKILLHMACLASMFFFITLARLNIGALKSKSYLFFLASTAFLSGVYAIPSAFFCIISRIYRKYTYFYFDIAILAIFVFATIKLVMLMSANKPQAEAVPQDDIDTIFESDDVASNANDIASESDTPPETTEEK